MNAVQDRPYQAGFVNGDARHPGVIPSWAAGDKAVLGLLPTGCGKTVCGGLVAIKARDELDVRTLFLANREELVNQTVATFGRLGLECGIEMGNQKIDDLSLFTGGTPDVCVATVQTLQRSRLTKRRKTEFGVIITDECHHARADSYRRIFDHFEDAYHLGITATPDRGDGRNLGAIYSTVAYEYSLRSAIRDGWLVPIVTMRLPCGVDLRDIKTTGGDFNQSELEDRIAPHIEALCDIARQEIGDRQTVIFTPDVGSAEAVADCLSRMGVSARAVSGKMDKGQRRDDLAQFARAAFQVVVCCDLLVEGWDCPRVACVVVMRPTRQRSRYAQMIGRGTRPYGEYGEKVDLLVLDFAFETTSDHKLVTVIDLFDDSGIDDEVNDIATDLLNSGKERDPMRAIDEAERIHRERTTFKIRLTGQKAVYQKFTFDPVGVGSMLGVPIKKGWDFNPANPATASQLASLKRMGVVSPEGISRTGAGKMLGALNKRSEANLATLKQVQYMADLGVDLGQARQMTFEDARATLDQIAPSRRAS